MTPPTDAIDMAVAPSAMAESAKNASRYLKSFAHEGRLMILCHLRSGEKSVSELEKLLETRQAAVSQMLARLREEQLVKTRRDGKVIYYSLADQHVEALLYLLYEKFCR